MRPDGPALPQAPHRAVPDAVPADQVTASIDRYLGPLGPRGGTASRTPATAPAPGPPAAFVCEDDVRAAVRAGARILVGPRTIVTPSARDAAAAADVFVWLSGTAR